MTLNRHDEDYDIFIYWTPISCFFFIHIHMNARGIKLIICLFCYFYPMYSRVILVITNNSTAVLIYDFPRSECFSAAALHFCEKIYS